jgi:hypothetical protein
MPTDADTLHACTGCADTGMMAMPGPTWRVLAAMTLGPQGSSTGYEQKAGYGVEELADVPAGLVEVRRV